MNPQPLLIGVTVLTSLDASDVLEIGFQGSLESTVTRLANIAHAAGLDGVVCSPQEAAHLRLVMPKDFVLVTPGIRLAKDVEEDQKRIMTPQAALFAGVNYLVVGRSIIYQDNIEAALDAYTR